MHVRTDANQERERNEWEQILKGGSEMQYRSGGGSYRLAQGECNHCIKMKLM